MAEGQSQGRIIDGKARAAELRKRVAADVLMQAERGVVPGLAVVVVGDDPASQVYVRGKLKMTAELGIHSIAHRLPGTVSQEALLELVAALNVDPVIHGILVQLPLPNHIDALVITEAIDPRKDVDGLHSHNMALLATGGDGMVPCTPLGCLMLLHQELGDLAGLHAVVVGRSYLVGKPLADLLLRENCTITIAHSRTRDLPSVCRNADILVAAVGIPRYIKGDWVKAGVTVIDVGINRTTDEKGKVRLIGDVDFDSVVTKAHAITPVPGGVGPMTIACLLLNTVTAAERIHASEKSRGQVR